MAIKIDKTILHHVRMDLATPFRISVGQVTEKEFMLVEAHSGDHVGWGEAAVDGVPFYTWETAETALVMGKRLFGPLMKSQSWESPDQFAAALAAWRGHQFTKAAFEAALWDIYGRIRQNSVSALLGGTRQWVAAGPSIGIKDSPEALVAAVRQELALAPTCRIKIKVAPGHDDAYLAAVRRDFADIPLMVDANSAYGPDDMDHITAWDTYNLLMIEQPFDQHDLYYHSLLCRRMKTPICLDESIETPAIAQAALAMSAADIINIKVGRVGGLCPTRRIHDLCQAAGIPNWIGSRIGTGVAMAMRLAAASLPNAVLPSDVGFARRYLAETLVTEPFAMRNGCEYRVPDGPGMGVEVDRDQLQRYTIATIIL